MQTPEDQPRQIYLEFCSKSHLEPRQELLDILDSKEESCKLHREDDEENETTLQESEMFAICLVISQNIETFLDLEIVNEVLDPSYLSMLASSFTTNTTLQRLALVGDSIDDQGIQNLMAVLVENNPLIELNLSQNQIKDAGAEAISQGLLSEACSIERLILSNNMIEMDYFGPVLENKGTLLELDLSDNNYSVESLAMLLQGAANNSSLLRLNLGGIKAAAELNPLIIVELIKANSSIQELIIDVEFDEETITKLEEALMENATMLFLVSANLPITLENPLTEKLFKILKANEWVAVNYEKLCNNEAVDCNEIIEEYVKAKLEMITLKLIDQQGDFVEEQSARLEESQLEVQPHDVSLQDEDRPEEEKENRPLKKPTPRSSKQGRSLEKIPSERVSLQSKNSINEESRPAQSKVSSYAAIDVEARFKAIEEEMEKRLMDQFSKTFEDKFANEMKKFSGQIHTVAERIGGLEDKVSGLEKKLGNVQSSNAQTLKSLQQRDINAQTIDVRLSSLDAQVSVLDNQIKSLDSNVQDLLARPAGRFNEMGVNEATSTVELDQVNKFDLEELITQRNDFEKTARGNFEEIFRKIEDFEGIMDQMLQDQLKGQDIVSKQLESSVVREKEEMDKVFSERVEGILSERLAQFENGFKAGIMNLRNTVYDTQNRMKNLEHVILENTELDFKSYKKKMAQNLPVTASVNANTSTRPQQNTSTIRSQLGTSKTNVSVSTINNKTQPSEVSKGPKTNVSQRSNKQAPSAAVKSQNITQNVTAPSLRTTILPYDLRPESKPEEKLESLEASRDASREQYNRFKTESPILKQDHPLSINELQEFSLSTHGARISYDRATREREEVKEDLKAKQLKEHALSNLPASIRRVKEDIKKKIEDYRAAISPYKKEKENQMEMRSAEKAAGGIRPDLLDSETKKLSKSLRAEPLGRGIQPSDELVLMLKTRGFAFSHS